MSFEIISAEELIKFDLELDTIESDISDNVKLYNEAVAAAESFIVSGVNKGMMIAFESRRIEGQAELGTHIESFTSNHSMTNVEYAVESMMDRAKVIFDKASDSVVRFFTAIFNFIKRVLRISEKKKEEAESDVIKAAKEADKDTEDNSELRAKHLVELSAESVILNELISGSSRHDIAGTVTLLLTYISDAIDLSNAAAGKYETLFTKATGNLSNLTDLDAYVALNAISDATDFEKTKEYEYLNAHMGNGEENAGHNFTADSLSIFKFLKSLGAMSDNDDGKLLSVIPKLTSAFKRKPTNPFGIDTVNRDKDNLVAICSEVDSSITSVNNLIRESKTPLTDTVKSVSDVNKSFFNLTTKFVARSEKYHTRNDIPKDGLKELRDEVSAAKAVSNDFVRILTPLGRSMATLTMLSMEVNLAAARVKSVCDNY